MPWLQISLEPPSSHVEQVAELLEELGAVSVTYGDAADQPVLEPGPGETPLWQRTRLTGLFEANTDPRLIRTALEVALPAHWLEDFQQETLADRPWERAWMDHFGPMRFGNRLWICPHDQQPQDVATDSVILKLDPGLAFGTGTHPTTALCLQWLDGADLRGATVLDYGCGSGVLAIAALLLGAERAIGTDNDPQALEASLENARRNGVSERLALYAPEALPEIEADITLANILAGPLIELAPRLTRLTRAGGHLVLSGILGEQAGQVSAAYATALTLDEPMVREDWVRIHGVRSRADTD
ncbi:MAG: 50S ribosomal protein L11 methyltransferase [Chromatiales bacterium]|nr:50S ribosomal protein L11 methyltransferase [Chromatiales bacterium]